MGERRLVAWSLASFHTAAFALVAALAGHLGGGLADLLGGLGTLPGVAAYGYLWLATGLATRWALGDGAYERVVDGALRPLFLRGVAAGALVGIAVLLGAFAVLAVQSALEGDLDLAAFLYIGLLGSAFAAGVGAAVGLATAVVDAVLFRAAAACSP